MYKKTSFILLFVSFMLLSCGEVGKEFDDYSEFIDYENGEGYVFLGRFQDVWPAEITGIETAMDEINFVLPDGTPHSYSGFEGYELKVVKLNSEKWKREFVVVLRSKDKDEKEKDFY